MISVIPKFNFSPLNLKLFPKNTECPPPQPLVFVKDASGTEIDREGRWLINGESYNLTGGPSNISFLRRYVRKQCPVTFNIVVVPKWIEGPKRVFRDTSMGLKRGQLFTNTAYKLKKSEKMNLLSNRRFNR